LKNNLTIAFKTESKILEEYQFMISQRVDENIKFEKYFDIIVT
jgi:hypothetical protein